MRFRPPALSPLERLQGWQAYPHLRDRGPRASNPKTGTVDVEGPLKPLPRDLTPGDYDAPPFTLGGQDDYAFSPDGQEICYTSNHDKVEATSTNNDLWIVSVNGGAAKNITAENPASDSTPLYSPDGKYIAYRAQSRPGYESDRFRLMLYDRKTGEKRESHRNDFDRWIGAFTFSIYSNEIFFLCGERAASRHSISVALPDSQPGTHPFVIFVPPQHGILGFDDDLATTPRRKRVVHAE